LKRVVSSAKSGLKIHRLPVALELPDLRGGSDDVGAVFGVLDAGMKPHM